jgi:hypothetical protein
LKRSQNACKRLLIKKDFFAYFVFRVSIGIYQSDQTSRIVKKFINQCTLMYSNVYGRIRGGGRRDARLPLHPTPTLPQGAKYVEGWPNTTSAWAGWSRFDIPVDRYGGVHNLHQKYTGVSYLPSG